ncbi:Hypothetical predicted protein, partial [Paramuricea clavata]
YDTRRVTDNKLNSEFSRAGKGEQGVFADQRFNYPNVDASRTPNSNRSTLEVDDIRQAQIEDSIIGKVYSFIKADKRSTTSERARESTDTQSLLREWQRQSIGSDGVLRRKKGTHDQIVLPRKYHAMVLRELHNNMSQLNSKKCKEMIISFLQYHLALDNAIYIDGSPVQSVSSFKLLGVLLREDLSWCDHIDYVI